MPLQLHNDAQSRLQEKLKQIRSSIVKNASSIAELEEQDTVSARHIDDAVQALLPPKRRHQRRKLAGFWSGILLGVSVPEVIRSFQSLQVVLASTEANRPPFDLLGLIVWIVVGLIGILLAVYGNS
jgi:hypothetical protein